MTSHVLLNSVEPRLIRPPLNAVTSLSRQLYSGKNKAQQVKKLKQLKIGGGIESWEGWLRFFLLRNEGGVYVIPRKAVKLKGFTKVETS